MIFLGPSCLYNTFKYVRITSQKLQAHQNNHPLTSFNNLCSLFSVVKQPSIDWLNFENVQNYRIFGLRPSSCILKNRRTQRFGNWICFHPQVRGQETPVVIIESYQPFTHIDTFWVFTPCSLVGEYQCFGGIFWLHLQGCLRSKIKFDSHKTSDLIKPIDYSHTQHGVIENCQKVISCNAVEYVKTWINPSNDDVYLNNIYEYNCYLSLYGATALCWALASFQFLNVYTVVGLLGRGISS
jgi:hypothetical protein